jgi:hypothetical protein
MLTMQVDHHLMVAVPDTTSLPYGRSVHLRTWTHLQPKTNQVC